MATKKTIAERFGEMKFSGKFLDLALWASVLQAEFLHGESLTPDEVVSLAKKILSRALDADFTRAEVEEFLRS